MVMKEKIITFKTAKLAKEAGFKAETHHYYIHYDNTPGNKGLCPNMIGKHYLVTNPEIINVSEHSFNFLTFQAPTQSLLQKWLRDKENIHICIDVNPYNRARWELKLFKIPGHDIGYSNTSYESYENALEKGLQFALISVITANNFNNSNND